MSSKTRKSAKSTKSTKVRKAAGTTITGKTCLVSKNRKQFIADHPWATNPHASVLQLAREVVAEGKPLVGNWAIGPRNVERVLGGAMPAPVREPKKASKPAKASAKASKAGKTTAVVAKVSPQQEAKPRRANGTLTPKREWEIRRALEAQGLSPKKVDKKTAKAMALLDA